MFTWNLYTTRPYLDPDRATESGSYIGELTNPDAIAENLISTFPKWNDSDILEIVRGKSRTHRNIYLYTVEMWRISPLAQRVKDAYPNPKERIVELWNEG
jgi:hypothetical protein